MSAESPVQEHQPHERRLVIRLLNYWRDRLDERVDERDFPALGDLRAGDIPDIWPWSFVLELREAEPPLFAMVGSAVADTGSSAGPAPQAIAQSVDDAHPDSLLSRACSYWPEAVARRVPITRGGEFRDRAGRLVLYRSILLPLSEDGEQLDRLLGAANCKIAGKEEEES